MSELVELVWEGGGAMAGAGWLAGCEARRKLGPGECLSLAGPAVPTRVECDRTAVLSTWLCL